MSLSVEFRFRGGTRIYAEGGSSKWAEWLHERYQSYAIPGETMSLSSEPEDGGYVYMSIEEILNAPRPPNPSEAIVGSQGRSAVAYLRTLPLYTEVAVRVCSDDDD